MPRKQAVGKIRALIRVQCFTGNTHDKMPATTVKFPTAAREVVIAKILRARLGITLQRLFHLFDSLVATLTRHIS